MKVKTKYGVFYGNKKRFSRKLCIVYTTECNKLDSLSYSDNGKKLSNEDKLEIIGYIEEALNERRTGGYRFSTESEDSTAFIALMKAIADRYKK